MSSTPVQREPSEIVPPVILAPPTSKLSALRNRADRIKRKATTKDGWIGDYDYAWYAHLFFVSAQDLTFFLGYVLRDFLS